MEEWWNNKSLQVIRWLNIRAEILLIGRIYYATHKIYPRVLYVKPSNKVYTSIKFWILLVYLRKLSLAQQFISKQ